MTIWLYLLIGIPFGLLGAWIAGPIDEYDPTGSNPVFMGFGWWLFWPFIIILGICILVILPIALVFIKVSEWGR